VNVHGHVKPKGIKFSEQEFRRSYSFLASMIGFVGFGCAVVALNSMRWSVFDSSSPSHANATVHGKLGLYYYELTLGNLTHGKTVMGRINNAASTALCNVMVYDEERDWSDRVDRNDCDLYLDAADDGSTLGIAAAIIGAAASIWASASAISFTEEESPFHKCTICPRLLTAAPVMSVIAMVMAMAAAWSYSRQRPDTPNFFLDQAFLPANRSLVEPFDAPEWELGMGIYLMISSACMYGLATVLLVYARRYNIGTQTAQGYLSVSLMDPEPDVEEASSDSRQDVLQVWESDIVVAEDNSSVPMDTYVRPAPDALERKPPAEKKPPAEEANPERPAPFQYNEHEPDGGEDKGLKTSLLSK